MTKKYLAGFLLALIITLCSCSQKKTDKLYSPDKRFQEYIFNQHMHGTVPECFDRLMMRQVRNRNILCYYYEKLYPECSGIIDLSGFYCDACDNGSWVDNVLILMEEARLGDEVLSLLEDETVMSDPIIEESGNFEVETVEKRLLDSYDRLKVMQYGTEYFIPSAKTESSVLVHYSNNSAIRLFYDNLYRLSKKELWKMISFYDSKIIGIEEYEYENESKLPSKKIVKTQAAKTVSKFNSDGLVIEADKYSAIQTEGDWEYEPKTSSVTLWEYDDQKRITVELNREKGITKKQRFFYHEMPETQESDTEEEKEEIPPDYEYYENNVLKIKTEYVSKSEYTTLIVFDRSNSVKTYYKDYAKVKDVYITDGVERRVKNYE